MAGRCSGAFVSLCSPVVVMMTGMLGGEGVDSGADSEVMLARGWMQRTLAGKDAGAEESDSNHFGWFDEALCR